MPDQGGRTRRAAPRVSGVHRRGDPGRGARSGNRLRLVIRSARDFHLESAGIEARTSNTRWQIIAGEGIAAKIDVNRRSLCRTGLLCVALLLIALPGSGLASSIPFWPTVVRSSGSTVPVASGVEYSHFSVVTTNGPLDIHQLSVDLGDSTVRLGMGLAGERLMSEDETVSSMARRSRAVAGVNGDYFDIHESGMPLSITVKDGQLLRSPVGWVAFVVDKDGRARIVRFRWTGSVVLTTTNESYFLAGYNSGFVSNGLVAVSNVRGYGAP